jgi:cyclophilin family peptidyl-prolyl cis-trans isomerase
MKRFTEIRTQSRIFKLSAIFIFFLSLPLLADAQPMVPQKKGLYAVLETDKGALVLELYPDAAPKTVDNFVYLINKKYFDGVAFHRVIPGFMAQSGDPSGTGRGSPGYTFEDEINADALGLNTKKVSEAPEYTGFVQQMTNRAVVERLGIKTEADWKKRQDEVQAEFRRISVKIMAMSVKSMLEMAGYRFTPKLPSKYPEKGSLAMANSGPDTNGSQFFINQVRTPHLTGLHTVFGQLISDFSVLETIIQSGNGNTKIVRATVVTRK